MEKQVEMMIVVETSDGHFIEHQFSYDGFHRLWMRHEGICGEWTSYEGAAIMYALGKKYAGFTQFGLLDNPKEMVIEFSECNQLALIKD